MKQLIRNKHWSFQKEYNIDKILYLLIDAPSINVNGTYYWFLDYINTNNLHRDYDLPAVISEDGHLCWFINNKYFRKKVVKPIIIHTDGYKEYY